MVGMLAPIALALLPGAALAASSKKSGSDGAAGAVAATTSIKGAGTPAVTIAAAAASVNPTAVSACSSPAPVAAVNKMISSFPSVYKTAKIVAGDSVAQTLYQSITSNATYAKALAFPPNVVKNYSPSFAGYNQNSDPACWWTDTTCTKPKQPYLPNDWATCPTAKTWGHTVDDGPLPAHCHLYELFRENNLAPSLFYIGSNVLVNPGSAAEGLALGSPICVHTWSHQYTTSLTTEQVFAELYYTKLVIKRVLGYTPRCWRPPFGDVDDRVRTIAYALELDTWVWDSDTNDWELGDPAPEATIQANFNDIIGNVSSSHGTIVLDHELSVPISNMFIKNYPAISKAFTNVVSAHTCNDQTSPWAEASAPRYPDMASWLAGGKPSGSLVATVDPSAAIIMIGTGTGRNLPYTASSSTPGGRNASINAAGSSPLIGVGAANGTTAVASNTTSASSSLPSAKVGAANVMRPLAGLLSAVGVSAAFLVRL